MAKTSLYSVTLTGSRLDVAIGSNEPITFIYGNNPWDTVAWAHGVKQKIGDARAIPCDPKTGRPAADAEKTARAMAVAARLQAGEWRMAAGDGGHEGGLLFRALVELGGKPETVRAKLAGMAPKQQAALRANPRVAPVIDRIRAAAAEGIDSDSLLDDII